MEERKFYIISYDISDQKRLKKVHQFLRDYGQWKQRSVFECWLNDKTYQELRKGLKKIINPRQDRVRFYRLCASCRQKIYFFGWGDLPSYENEVIL